jgi:hypothetical protein
MKVQKFRFGFDIVILTIISLLILVAVLLMASSCRQDLADCSGFYANDKYDIVLTVSRDGFWEIDNQTTAVRATEPCAEPVVNISASGYWTINEIITDILALEIVHPPVPQPNLTISDDGYWIINGNVSNVVANPDALTNPDIQPDITISEDGFWVIDGEKTDICARNCEDIENQIFTVIFLSGICYTDTLPDKTIFTHCDTVRFEVKYGDYIDKDSIADPVKTFNLSDIKLAGLYPLNSENVPILRFEGWYIDSINRVFNFDYPIRSELVIRAKYSEVPVPLPNINPHDYGMVDEYINAARTYADTTVRRYALVISQNILFGTNDNLPNVILRQRNINFIVHGVENSIYKYVYYIRNMFVKSGEDNVFNCNLTFSGRLLVQPIDYVTGNFWNNWVAQGTIFVNSGGGLTVTAGAALNARVHVEKATFVVMSESFVRYLFIGKDSVVVLSDNAIIYTVEHNSEIPWLRNNAMPLNIQFSECWKGRIEKIIKHE